MRSNSNLVIESFIRFNEFSVFFRCGSSIIVSSPLASSGFEYWMNRSTIRSYPGENEFHQWTNRFVKLFDFFDDIFQSVFYFPFIRCAGHKCSEIQLKYFCVLKFSGTRLLIILSANPSTRGSFFSRFSGNNHIRFWPSAEFRKPYVFLFTADDRIDFAFSGEFCFIHTHFSKAGSFNRRICPLVADMSPDPEIACLSVTFSSNLVMISRWVIGNVFSWSYENPSPGILRAAQSTSRINFIFRQFYTDRICFVHQSRNFIVTWRIISNFTCLRKCFQSHFSPFFQKINILSILSSKGCNPTSLCSKTLSKCGEEKFGFENFSQQIEQYELLFFKSSRIVDYISHK